MRKKYGVLILKSAIGLAVIYGIWWIVKCQCINLKMLTPAAMRDYIQGFGRLAAVVYIIAYALNTVSVMPPIAPLSLAAGLAFGSVLGAIYLMSGAMIGTTLTFVISRFFGRDMIKRLLKGRFKNLDERLGKNGFMTILFFRVIPLMPYEVLNYAGGLSKIRFKDYCLATFLGLIPGVIISAFFGGSLGDIKGVRDIFAPKFLLAVGLMAMIIAVPAIYQTIKGKKVSHEK